MKTKISKLAELKEEVSHELAFEAEYAERVRADREEMAFDAPAPVPESRAEKTAYDLIDEASAHLAQDGRDFIAALFWMATGAGFSDASISLLCAVAAYEDCKELDERGCEITDAELSHFMGCCERTLQRKRRRYYQDEKRLKVPFLRITEGDYDKSREQNRPTRYQFLRDREIADAVLDARLMSLYQEDRRQALKLAALRVYDSIPQSPGAIRRRRKRELSIDSERKRIINTIRTSIARLKEIQGRMDGDFSEEWQALKDELETIYNSTNPSQTVAELKHNLGGRQNVAPSDWEESVNKNMPKDATLSDYLKVPSVAREVRAGRREREGARYG